MTGEDIGPRIGQALRLAPALLRRDPIFRYAAIGALMVLILLIGRAAQDWAGPGAIPATASSAVGRPSATGPASPALTQPASPPPAGQDAPSPAPAAPAVPNTAHSSYQPGAVAIVHAAPDKPRDLQAIPADSVGGFVYDGGPVSLNDLGSWG